MVWTLEYKIMNDDYDDAKMNKMMMMMVNIMRWMMMMLTPVQLPANGQAWGGIPSVLSKVA